MLGSMIRAFNSIRNCQTVSKEAVCVILGSHQRCMKIPDDFNPCQIVNWQLACQSFNFSYSSWGVVVSHYTRGSRYHPHSGSVFCKKDSQDSKKLFYSFITVKDDILKSAMGKDEWGKSRRNGVQASRSSLPGESHGNMLNSSNDV